MKLPDLAAALDDDRYGGKAAELGAAQRAGLSVPEGFAISHESVEAIIQDDERQSQLIERVNKLNGPYVVRSSGVAEDSDEASFAGQHVTVINIRNPAGVISALDEVYTSARSEAVMEYRANLGIEAPPRMGAIVQSLVVADKSGVLFSQNPVDGSDERVIEACWGLGKAVVDSLVTPDNFRVRPGGEIVDRRVGTKDVRVIPAPEGGTQTKPVPNEKQNRLCLTDEELQALDRLAKQCESYRSGGHDIEWAFENDDLYLLQRRDITTR